MAAEMVVYILRRVYVLLISNLHIHSRHPHRICRYYTIIKLMALFYRSYQEQVEVAILPFTQFDKVLLSLILDFLHFYMYLHSQRYKLQNQDCMSELS